MKTLEQRAVEWVVGGDTGLSSKAIYAHMMGAAPRRGFMGGSADHPHDPDDLGRCLRLLEVIPEWKSRIGEMAKYGPYWAALVEHWDRISASMIEEVGIDWSKGRNAKVTYDLMHEISDRVRKAA